MTLRTIPTQPISGQKPGTSGLRKKTRVFMQPHYLQNFVQAMFDVVGVRNDKGEGKTFVLGGDGRYFNDQAAQIILAMAAASMMLRVLSVKGVCSVMKSARARSSSSSTFSTPILSAFSVVRKGS